MCIFHFLNRDILVTGTSDSAAASCKNISHNIKYITHNCMGYKTTSVEFEVQEREAGVSKWSPWSLVKYAFTNIVAFTTFPLQLVTITGAICFICSLVLMVYSLVQYFTGSAVEGYTTLLMVLLLVGSAMMISLGIIGYYISKIYEEVKRRPRYIISKVIKNGNIQD